MEIKTTTDGILIPVKVTPKAGKTEVLPLQAGDDRLRVKVKEPPEDGKANKAVCALLAKTLGVPKSSVSVASGETARLKMLLVKNGQPDDVMQVLHKLN